jgi:imidazolonepropionase-like amidohydrolase
LHARSQRRLTLRSVIIIYGSARPPHGPVDVVIEDGLISSIGSTGGRLADGPPDAIIGGTGKYVMPGSVNTHMHWQEERQPGMPLPIQYERNLYLAAGVTAARSRWRVRPLEALAGREQRPHHHRAAHPRVSPSPTDVDARGA